MEGKWAIYGLPNDWIGIFPGALEAVLARIVAAGKRVAVCEQVQPSSGTAAKPSAGVKIERIVTLGRLVEPTKSPTASLTGPGPGWSDGDYFLPAEELKSNGEHRQVKRDAVGECLADLVSLIDAGYPREDIAVQRALREAKKLLNPNGPAA